MHQVEIVSAPKSLIKSKKRVQDAGEVYTPDFLVEQMLDQYPIEAWDKQKNWLEPTCGNGQFILGIIARKIAYGARLLEAVDTTFGCDIMSDNVSECHSRIYAEIVMPHIRTIHPSRERWETLRWKLVCIVETNIRPTKDALKEDFTKWVRFIDLPEVKRIKMESKVKEIFALVDAGDGSKLTNRTDVRLFKELSNLKR